jgi:hypothetical protein|tara:strand:+ start:311 stop:568 length:258 start_codon:yes stop_codon:yes gene_type:complete
VAAAIQEMDKMVVLVEEDRQALQDQQHQQQPRLVDHQFKVMMVVMEMVVLVQVVLEVVAVALVALEKQHLLLHPLQTMEEMGVLE